MMMTTILWVDVICVQHSNVTSEDDKGDYSIVYMIHKNDKRQNCMQGKSESSLGNHSIRIWTDIFSGNKRRHENTVK